MKVCVSVDMDTYREYQQLVDPGGTADGPCFYDDAIPRFLDLFDECGIRATFFMIGSDAAPAGKRRRVQEIVARGHEVGNHSHSHPYNFRALSRAQKIAEIEQADAAIADVTGVRPVGFRTPSLDVDAETLQLVAERGYRYDSSICPGPFMWAFMLYGKLFVRHGSYQLGSVTAPFAPSRPYVPRRDKLHRRATPGSDAALPLLEIPLSLVPGTGIPFYGTLMRRLGTRAFDLGVRAYGRKRGALHYLLHLLDLVQLEGSTLDAALDRTPGVGLGFEQRRAFTGHVMQRLAQLGEAVPMRELAEACRTEHGVG